MLWRQKTPSSRISHRLSLAGCFKAELISAPFRGISFDPAYPQRLGNQRGVMERMSDAENPNLKPWAQKLMRKYNQDVLNGHRAFSSQSRCWPGGTPGQLLFPAEPVYFIKTPKEVDHLAAPARGAPHLF
jgi:hypothetical protein